jgi:hypothetical protein
MAPPTPCNTRGHQQLVEGFGLRTKQRSERKQDYGAEKNAFYSHPIGKPAASRQHYRHGQHIGDHHRLHAQRTFTEAGCHCGQRGVNDGGIQRLHEEAKGDNP